MPWNSLNKTLVGHKNIEKSPNDKYWVDETYLDSKHGSKVFTQELVAVAKMEVLLKSYDLEINGLEKLIEFYEKMG